jgi:hypothetical protein
MPTSIIKDYFPDLPTRFEYEKFLDRVKQKCDNTGFCSKITIERLQPSVPPSGPRSSCLFELTNSPSSRTIERSSSSFETNNFENDLFTQSLEISEVVTENKVDWPKNFQFPKEKLSDKLLRKLSDAKIKLTNKEINILVQILFDKMWNLGL